MKKRIFLCHGGGATVLFFSAPQSGTPSAAACIRYGMEAEMGEFVIYETDERMFYLKRLLTGLRPLVNTHIFAPNLTLTAERLERVGEGEMLICGKLDEKAAELASQKGVKVRYLMSDEKFMAKNAC